MVGWGLRTFRSRSPHLMLTVFKTLVQPHLDYCSQLWSPCSQAQINLVEGVQRHLLNRIRCQELSRLNYWEKLQYLRLYSQERRRERYQIIYIWKISQGLVSGFSIPFWSIHDRSGRRALLPPLTRPGSVPAVVQRARESSLSTKGARLFNLLPIVLRNANHGDILMWKNNLDIFLSSVFEVEIFARVSFQVGFQFFKILK